MTTERYIDVRGVSAEIVRKDIKNLHVGVYPPTGRVRVAVPLRLDDDAVRLALISRLGWIRRQQAGFENQDRQSQREFVTGESHYFDGRRYRLDVIEHHGHPAVRLRNNTTMELRIGPDADREPREATVHRWYRRRLRDQLPALLARWEPEVGVTVTDVRIKKMKTRWGSCNAEAGRIWMNLELAKKPASCLAYILMHEMVHFLERDHNDRFRELMDRFMPQWRLHRDELNRAPLARGLAVLIRTGGALRGSMSSFSYHRLCYRSRHEDELRRTSRKAGGFGSHAICASGNPNPRRLASTPRGNWPFMPESRARCSPTPTSAIC